MAFNDEKKNIIRNNHNNNRYEFISRIFHKNFYRESGVTRE